VQPADDAPGSGIECHCGRPVLLVQTENVSDIGTCPGLYLNPPAKAGGGRNGVQFTLLGARSMTGLELKAEALGRSAGLPLSADCVL
jgi:hypothetical protein